jgi:hypothetical protein
MHLTTRSAIRSLETAQCDRVAWRVGDEWVRFAVKLMNLIQLCVQVGETSKLLVNSYPPGGGESALPYGGRLAIERRSARGERR